MAPSLLPAPTAGRSPSCGLAPGWGRGCTSAALPNWCGRESAGVAVFPTSRTWAIPRSARTRRDRKSTRLNSSHTEIYTLSLHDALPILHIGSFAELVRSRVGRGSRVPHVSYLGDTTVGEDETRSEEHPSELQSHRDLHSFPTRRSSDLAHRQLCRTGAVASRPG